MARSRPKLPIYPGNPPREQIRALARGEAARCQQRSAPASSLDACLDQPLARAGHELKGSPTAAPSRLPPSPAMSLAQRYTMPHMADAC